MGVFVGLSLAETLCGEKALNIVISVTAARINNIFWKLVRKFVFILLSFEADKWIVFWRSLGSEKTAMFSL
jgi:hypothetical protein